MQYTTIRDVWVAFDEMCDEAPQWDRDEMQAKLKERFPGRRYEEITPDDVADLVQQMRDEATTARLATTPDTAPTATGWAVLTATTEQFLDSCPAVIDYSVDPNSSEHCTFRYDPTAEVNGPIPVGIWFAREGGVQVALISRDHDSLDYAGFASENDAPFRVQIREDAAPHWYDSQLDDDAKAEVLDAIDAI